MEKNKQPLSIIKIGGNIIDNPAELTNFLADFSKIDGNKISYSITFNGTTIDSTGDIINENEILIKNQFGEMKLTRVKS